MHATLQLYKTLRSLQYYLCSIFLVCLLYGEYVTENDFFSPPPRMCVVYYFQVGEFVENMHVCGLVR